jgi:hypothetical protein
MTILFLGGGGVFGPIEFVDEALDNVKTAIVDDDRRKEATATLKAINKRSKDYTKAVKRMFKELKSDFAEHDVSGSAVDRAWDSFFGLHSDYSHDVVELRFQLRDQLSREEWEAMFPIQSVE